MPPSSSAASCGLVANPSPAGTPPRRRRGAAPGSNQGSSRYRRRSTRVCPCREAYPTNTPTWQLSRRPSVPEDCRPTPAEHVPFFANPVSSTTSTPSAAPSCSPTSRCNSATQPASSQGESLISCCSLRGGAPTRSAMFSTFLRAIGSSSPATYRCPHRRPSLRQKNRPKRAWNASSSGSSAARSAPVIDPEPMSVACTIAILRQATPSKTTATVTGGPSRASYAHDLPTVHNRRCSTSATFLKRGTVGLSASCSSCRRRADEGGPYGQAAAVRPTTHR